MGKGDETIEPIYGPGNLSQFAKIIDIPPLTAEHTEQLERTAWVYRFLAGLERKPGPDDDWDRILPSRSERRKALQQVAKQARALKRTLKDRAIIFLGKDQLPAFDTQSLDDLAEAADLAAGQVPLGGADPKEARITFVRLLAEIYEDAAQRPATRQHDPFSGLDCGPFLEFARAALKPLNASALKGLEHDVRRVAAERSSR